MQCWRLDDGRQTLVLAARRTRLPEVIYWGAPLPATDNLETLADAHRLDVTGGMLDENPDLSICPEAGRTFPGQPGLILRAHDGTPLLPKFCYAAQETTKHSITLTYADDANGLTYRAEITLDADTHVLTLTSEINAETPVHLHWLSAPVLPAPQNSEEMIDVSGRWCGESVPKEL